MWASPSKIPTSISLTLSGNFIKALSEEDKRTTPLVVRAANKTQLMLKNKKVLRSLYIFFYVIIHIISNMFGLYLQSSF